MCLGIYESTGSFSFSTTTEKDLLAASFFIKNGANINVVSSLINRELSVQQIKLLNDLLVSVVNHKINGVDIFIAKVAYEQVFENFSDLVKKTPSQTTLGFY
jgi:tRNA nucleotidyltransferase (CCA-adding enzyme)